MVNDKKGAHLEGWVGSKLERVYTCLGTNDQGSPGRGEHPSFSSSCCGKIFKTVSEYLLRCSTRRGVSGCPFPVSL